VIGEELRPRAQLRGTFERTDELIAIENVVAEDQAHRQSIDEVGPDDEGLRDPSRARLLPIGEAHSDVASILEQSTNHRQIAGRADDENVADAGEHQRRQRIIDRRLVVNREQLLADRSCQRIQTGGAATGEEDPFHDFSGIDHTLRAGSTCAAPRISSTDILNSPASERLFGPGEVGSRIPRAERDRIIRNVPRRR